MACTRDLGTPDISAKEGSQFVVTLDQADGVKSRLQNETQSLRDRVQKFLQLEQLRAREARVAQQLKEERQLTTKVDSRVKA